MRCAPARLQQTDTAYVKFDFIRHLRHFCLKLVAHIVLFLFITGEDADLANVRAQKTVEHGVAERTDSTGD